MGYVAVRASVNAIEAAERLASERRLRVEHPLTTDQITEQLALAVDKVMAEGGVMDAELAALSLQQADGDVIEAAFLLRAYRSTLPRLGYSASVTSRDIVVRRRISSVFRDIPGGQILGETRDYSQRLLEIRSPRGLETVETSDDVAESDAPEAMTPVVDVLRAQGLMAEPPATVAEAEPFDITRMPMRFPMPRSGHLQALARGEAGGMLALAYSSMRGWGGAGHGALAELRAGELPLRIFHPITGRPAVIGHITVTEVQYVSGGRASLQDDQQSEYEMGYGLVPGRDERKAISMAIIDASLRLASEDSTKPVENQEFVISHIDPIESSGFVEHLKLPHYVTFQAGLQRARRLQELMEASRA
ncbi:MAG: carbon-phosphorus lyase complex subunit PhnI [Chloroflexota bacterium]